MHLHLIESLQWPYIDSSNPFAYPTDKEYTAIDPVLLCTPKYQAMIEKLRSLAKHLCFDDKALHNVVAKVYEDIIYCFKG